MIPQKVVPEEAMFQVENEMGERAVGSVLPEVEGKDGSPGGGGG